DKVHPMEPSGEGLVELLWAAKVGACKPSSSPQRLGTHARLPSQASTTSACGLQRPHSYLKLTSDVFRNSRRILSHKLFICLGGIGVAAAKSLFTGLRRVPW